MPTHRITITALGNQVVPNNAYSGPAATTTPYNQKFVTPPLRLWDRPRHGHDWRAQHGHCQLERHHDCSQRRG